MSNENSLLEENKINQKQKTLLIHKLKDDVNNINQITEEIEKNLFSATNYFSHTNPVIIGKRVKLNEMKNI